MQSVVAGYWHKDLTAFLPEALAKAKEKLNEKELKDQTIVLAATAKVLWYKTRRDGHRQVSPEMLNEHIAIINSKERVHR